MKSQHLVLALLEGLQAKANSRPKRKSAYILLGICFLSEVVESIMRGGDILHADVEAPVGLITAEKLKRVKERLREILGSEVILKVRLFEFKDVSESDG